MEEQTEKYKGLQGNKNAEKWTFDTAKKKLEECLEVAKDRSSQDNDFIGEVAQACDTTLNQLDHITKKFPELKDMYYDIKSHCESNCFKNGKKGNINASLAIMNLKSNHGWTDRVENKNTNTNTNFNANISKEEAKKLNDFLEDDV